MSSLKIVTFGCRLNAFESEVIREKAAEAGLKDAVIVNSCAVTAEAERQLRQVVRRERRERPDAEIIVTGCAAQIFPARYLSMTEVDRVVGNVEKLQSETWVTPDPPRMLVNDIATARETASHLISAFEGRTRAFIEIQQGCDHRCSFCIIPLGRGPNRSVPVGGIVDQVRHLVENDYREIVLTGVDITDYGKDLPGKPTLAGLIRRVLALVPELPRLRLSSLDPGEIDDEFFAVAAEEERLMPHFHLSVQSGDDLILKRMKRRHLRADIERFVLRMRTGRPDAVFGADLIAGFPTESEQAFERSLSLVRDCGFTWLHVFPYSERPGTPAARMPQVSGNVRRERAARLREAGKRQVSRYLDSCIGSTNNILIEEKGQGRSPQFARVRYCGEAETGQIVTAEFVDRRDDVLVARKAA